MPIALGLDLGTTKIAAIALDLETGRLLARNAEDAPGPMPGRPKGWDERGASAVSGAAWRVLYDVARRVAGDDVRCLGITGQMHGVLLTTEDGAPLTPLYTWRDRRTAEGSLERARGLLPETLAERAGCGLHPGYGGATLHWLAEEGQIPSGAVALSLAGWVAQQLGGVRGMDPTHAASWGLFDARVGAWDEAAAASLGLPASLLPPIRPCGSPMGRLRSDIADELGLTPDVHVCAPIGDNQAAVLAATGGGAGVASVNIGTGAQVCAPSTEWLHRPPLETRPDGHGGYLLVGASLCGGWAWAWLRGVLSEVSMRLGGRMIEGDALYDTMRQWAEQAPAGAEGLRVDPRFAGERGRPEVRGAIEGIREANFTLPNLARATLEGIARELGDLWRTAGVAGARELVGSGNALRRNPLLRDIVAAELGLPLRLSPWEEEAAVGAALCAASGCGLEVHAG